MSTKQNIKLPETMAIQQELCQILWISVLFLFNVNCSEHSMCVLVIFPVRRILVFDKFAYIYIHTKKKKKKKKKKL